MNIHDIFSKETSTQKYLKHCTHMNQIHLYIHNKKKQDLEQVRKRPLCKQSCIIGKMLKQDFEALTSNSGSTCVTVCMSLNQSIYQSSISLSLFRCRVKVLDQINGFPSVFCGVNLEVIELVGAMHMSSGSSIPAGTVLFFFISLVIVFFVRFLLRKAFWQLQ